MRIAIILAAIAGLSACGRQQPVDCTKIDMASFDRCWAQNRAKGEASAVVACRPFSERLSTEGVWVVGFEKNDFFEGKRQPPNDGFQSRSTGAALIVDERLFKPAHPVRAFEVAVVGRRALCPVGVLNAYPIAVEKLRIRRRIS
jgi:hypothetical protein